MSPTSQKHGKQLGKRTVKRPVAKKKATPMEMPVVSFAGDRGVVGLAGIAPSLIDRGLGQDRQEGVGSSVDHVCGGIGCRPCLGLDRRTEGEVRRGVVAAKVHATRPPQHVVEDQSRKGDCPYCGGEDDALRAGGSRTGKEGRSLGSSVRIAESCIRAGGPRNGSREEPPRQEILRDPRFTQPLRCSVPGAARQELPHPVRERRRRIRRQGLPRQYARESRGQSTDQSCRRARRRQACDDFLIGYGGGGKPSKSIPDRCRTRAPAQRHDGRQAQVLRRDRWEEHPRLDARCASQRGRDRDGVRRRLFPRSREERSPRVHLRGELCMGHEQHPREPLLCGGAHGGRLRMFVFGHALHGRSRCESDRAPRGHRPLRRHRLAARLRRSHRAPRIGWREGDRGRRPRRQSPPRHAPRASFRGIHRGLRSSRREARISFATITTAS